MNRSHTTKEKPRADAPSTAEEGLKLEPFRFERREWLILGGLILLSILTRSYRAGWQSFWIDEFDTYRDAMSIFEPGFWRRSNFFFFALVRLSLFIGYNEWSLRLPSILGGVLAVPAIYLLARRWLGMAPAVAAAILTLLSPYQVHFAHEARYYTLVTLFATCTLYALTTFGRSFRLRDLLLVILFGLMTYGCHPAAALFLIAVLCFALLLLLHFKQYRRLAAIFGRAKAKRMATLVTGAVFLSALFFMQRSFARAFAHLFERLLAFPDIEMTQGVDFSRGFFLLIFKKFPILYGLSQVTELWRIYFFFFLLGMVYCWRHRKRWIPLLFLLIYSLTILGLVLYRSEIPYTEKYIIFLYPQYAILAGCGVFYLSTLVTRIIERLAGKTPSVLVVTATLATLTALLYSPDLRELYTKEIFPTKSTLNYLAAEAGEDAVFLCSGYAHKGSQFYAGKFGFDPRQFIRVRPKEPEKLFREMIRQVGLNREVWFILTLPHGYALSMDQVTEMIGPYFKRVREIPSYASVEWTHQLFQLAPRYPLIGMKPTRFLVSTAGAERTDPAAGALPAMLPLSAADADGNTLSFATEVEVIDPGDLYAALHPQERMPISEATVEMGGRLYVLKRSPDAGGGWVSPLMAMTEGKHPVTLTVHPEHTGENHPAFEGTAVLGLGSPDHRIIKPYHYTAHCSSMEPIYRRHGGDLALIIYRSGYYEWEVDLPGEDQYQLALTALHDRPAPVQVRFEVDGEPAGMLSYDKADMRLEQQRLSLPALSPGKHLIRLTFMNSILGQADEDANRSCEVAELRVIRRGTPGYLPVNHDATGASGPATSPGP